jgi:crotonobetainyl-CoA:carnitine CoA-transferase CaiB-like acyl-CoA transferase
LTSETARALDAVVSVAGVHFVASPIRLGAPAPVRFPPKLDEHGNALRREFGLPEASLIPRPARAE